MGASSINPDDMYPVALPSGGPSNLIADNKEEESKKRTPSKDPVPPVKGLSVFLHKAKGKADEEAASWKEGDYFVVSADSRKEVNKDKTSFLAKLPGSFTAKGRLEDTVRALDGVKKLKKVKAVAAAEASVYPKPDDAVTIWTAYPDACDVMTAIINYLDQKKWKDTPPCFRYQVVIDCLLHPTEYAATSKPWYKRLWDGIKAGCWKSWIVPLGIVVLLIIFFRVDNPLSRKILSLFLPKLEAEYKKNPKSKLFSLLRSVCNLLFSKKLRQHVLTGSQARKALANKTSARIP